MAWIVPRERESQGASGRFMVLHHGDTVATLSPAGSYGRSLTTRQRQGLRLVSLERREVRQIGPLTLQIRHLANLVIRATTFGVTPCCSIPISLMIFKSTRSNSVTTVNCLTRRKLRSPT